METHEPLSPAEAEAALAAAASAEHRVDQILVSTRWYAPWYGVTVALLPLTGGLFGAGHVIAASVTITVMFVGLVTLVRTYQRVTGLWPSSRPQQRGMMLLVGILLMGANYAAFLATARWDMAWLVAVITVVTAPVMAGLSRLFDLSLVRHR